MSRRTPSYEAPERFKWTDIPTGICFAIMLLAAGLALAINLRPLYYLNIEWFDLVEESGLNAVVIKENYNALIDYCSPFYRGDLVFPSLRASESGLSHFAECKQIFNIIYLAGAISLVVVIISFILKKRSNQYKYLRTCAITTLILPVLVGGAALINFEAIFYLFHRLVFSNDDWLFDPVTDPIINLLPESYFLECALIIIGVMVIGAVIVLITYFVRKKNRKVERLLPGKKNYFY